MKQDGLSGDVIALADLFSLWAGAMVQIDPHCFAGIHEALSRMREGYELNNNIKGIELIDYIISKLMTIG